jgi:solute carrier family 25 folate transporter 32
MLHVYKAPEPFSIFVHLVMPGYFYFYEQAKRRWLSDQGPNTTFHHFAASVEAGMIMVALTNPIWLVKTRMQLQLREIADTATAATTAPLAGSTVASDMSRGVQQQRPYRSFTDALATIVREEGPLALYKGSIPALMLVSHGAVQFMVYERLKSETASMSFSSSTFGSANYIVLGGVSKIIASVTTYPIQVIKTRLQQRQLVTTAAEGNTHERPQTPGSSEAAAKSRETANSTTKKATWSGGKGLIVGTRAQYRGVVDCVRKTWVNEGIYGFFKGCLPNAIRVAPGAGITFFTYETVADALRLRS